MRVLLVEPGASWAIADVSAGLRYGLEQLGVQIVSFRLDTRIARAHSWLYSNWRKAKKTNPAIAKPTLADVLYQAGDGLLSMALRHEVDYVLVVSAMYLHPDLVILMKRAGLRVAVLFTESPYDTDKELNVARHIDVCWTNERSALERFQTVCPSSRYLPHAWHPLRHVEGAQPGDEAVAAHDVVFVGTGFAERVKMLSAIDWTGIDFGLYGTWDDLGSRHPLRQHLRGKQVDNAQAAALYRRAKIGLNLYRTSMGFGLMAPQIDHAESLNPRAYELAKCGAFHLSNHRAEVSEVFGELVPTFETPDQASQLIRQWLADDAGRARVSRALPARVAESSWLHRAAAMNVDLEALREAA
jgi:spore maturation protein CgeB